jgi:YebC/PmpR family DNA-binding regulatory protein
MEGEHVEEVRYEGYGPGGIALMVDCMTNNRNRSVADVRFVFTKHGGNLGTDGSVSYLFKKQGLITFPSGVNEDALMSLALDLNALDVNVNDDGSMDVITTPEDFFTIKSALMAKGMQPAEAEVTMIANTKVLIDDKETAEKVMSLIDALEDLDDVQAVYSNVDIADEAFGFGV